MTHARKGVARRSLGAVVVIAMWSACPTGARAQGTETKLERAERLFAEGRDAIEASRFAEACVKLTESQQLDPATGTLLALAICHEGEGKLATAWREFSDVATQSAAQGRADRVTLARQRLRALDSRVARMTVSVGGIQLPAGLELRADGQVLVPSQWNQPIVVETGSHRIEASAPGKRPWQTTIVIGEAERKAVKVPSLEDLGPESSPSTVSTPAAAPDETPRPNRTAAFVVGGAGLVAFGVGTVFGLRALDSQSEAEKRCRTSPCSDRVGVDANADARTQAWVANVGVGLGIVGLGVATWLFLRQQPARSVTVAPSAGPRSGGVSLQAVF